ncbi:uncharacterized protein LOC101864685 isoform X2 [Aplysia californica]|uniref:Uncharacterized protein LOC101864685 isoform X2 n=1 Tax=Aplysia californica TaxID=6500 RepID=A0ABM0JM77_APLCA|nr:uncharacterized protein LOC101864685 isoform X2 [Aplysia californica]
MDFHTEGAPTPTPTPTAAPTPSPYQQRLVAVATYPCRNPGQEAEASPAMQQAVTNAQQSSAITQADEEVTLTLTRAKYLELQTATNALYNNTKLWIPPEPALIQRLRSRMSQYLQTPVFYEAHYSAEQNTQLQAFVQMAVLADYADTGANLPYMGANDQLFGEFKHNLFVLLCSLKETVASFASDSEIATVVVKHAHSDATLGSRIPNLKASWKRKFFVVYLENVLQAIKNLQP